MFCRKTCREIDGRVTGLRRGMKNRPHNKTHQSERDMRKQLFSELRAWWWEISGESAIVVLSDQRQWMAPKFPFDQGHDGPPFVVTKRQGKRRKSALIFNHLIVFQMWKRWELVHPRNFQWLCVLVARWCCIVATKDSLHTGFSNFNSNQSVSEKDGIFSYFTALTPPL